MELQAKGSDAVEPMLPKHDPSPATDTSSGHEDRDEEGTRTFQYLATLAACCGAMTAGCALGWSSPALPLLKSDESPLGEPISGQQGSWVGALLALGALCGAMPGGMVAERYGRRPTLAALAVPLLCGWGLIAAATGPKAIYIARFLLGAATGATSAVAPVYVGEVACAELRGALGSSFQLLLVTGVLFVYTAGALVSFRWLAALCALPAAAMLAGVLIFAPESPAFLMGRGDEEGARRSLRRLRGVGADLETPLRELREAPPSAGSSMRALLATPARRRALVISLMLMFIQQMSGINAIVFYTQEIFDKAGSSLAPEAATCLSGVVMVAATGAATLLADRAGRRLLLLLSAAVMAVCLFALGVCFKAPDSAPGWLSLLAVALYLIAFSIGFGPLPWMMLGELFASEVKFTAGALAAAFNWVIVFIVTFAFEPAANAVGGHNVFWAFCAVCVLATVYVFFFVFETKGKSLQEIQRELAGGDAAQDDAISL